MNKVSDRRLMEICREATFEHEDHLSTIGICMVVAAEVQKEILNPPKPSFESLMEGHYEHEPE